MVTYISVSSKCLNELHTMNRLYIFLTVSVMSLVSGTALAQTAASLFWRSDSLQVNEIVSETGDQYRKVGHHGPAVENSHMALRIYFNDSGAIDVYSKTGRGMELEEYLWYPTPMQQEHGAGNDEYLVGKTVGLGGWRKGSEACGHQGTYSSCRRNEKRMLCRDDCIRRGVLRRSGGHFDKDRCQ